MDQTRQLIDGRLEHERILAVGCVTNSGEITLNYVSPDARFRGISTTLLDALERRAIELGNSKLQLESTETARRFYLARGYVEQGLAGGKFGTSSGYPMSKIVRASDRRGMIPGPHHFPSVALTPSHTAPTKPVTMTVITALNV
jgi:GNAT superfamily N-acetyltransferase